MTTVIRVVHEVDGMHYAASWGVMVDGLIVTKDDLAKTSRELLNRYALPNAEIEHATEHEFIYRIGCERYWFEVDLGHPVTIGNRRYYGIDKP